MTEYDSGHHRRRSVRLRGYDYARPGAYFLTVCTNGRECLFGSIAQGRMELDPRGRIVAEEWTRTGEIRQEIDLDEWVVMPNHLHGIVLIGGQSVGRSDWPIALARAVGPHRRSVGALMAGFKSAATRRINLLRGAPGAAVWQRNYYERIIRDEASLNRIREYIASNPARWPHAP